MSDSSYQTTYSQDERIESCLKQKRQLKEEKMKKMIEQLEDQYENYFIDNINNKHSIFNWPGMYFIDFTNKKIKFSFTPSEVVAMVSKRVKFYCSIRFRNNRWTITRNSIPITCRTIIYNWFYNPLQKNIISLEDILAAIEFIYEQLLSWCAKEEMFRKEKKMSYLNGEDVELDSDDEELFVSPHDVEERRRKRDEILKRMIPPPEMQHQHRQLRLRM